MNRYRMLSIGVDDTIKYVILDTQTDGAVWTDDSFEDATAMAADLNRIYNNTPSGIRKGIKDAGYRRL